MYSGFVGRKRIIEEHNKQEKKNLHKVLSRCRPKISLIEFGAVARMRDELTEKSASGLKDSSHYYLNLGSELEQILKEINSLTSHCGLRNVSCQGVLVIITGYHRSLFVRHRCIGMYASEVDSDHREDGSWFLLV